MSLMMRAVDFVMGSGAWLTCPCAVFCATCSALSPLSSEGDMRFEESSDTVKSSHFLMLIRIYHTACKKYSDNPANPVTSSSYSAG